MEKKVLFVGEYPIDYGGITRKSSILFGELNKRYITKLININVKKHKKISFLISAIKLICFMGKYKNVVYCIDSHRMYALIRLQFIFFPKSLKNTIVVFSGGDISRLDGKSNRKTLSIIKKVKSVWVESWKYGEALHKMGFDNTVYYPNPRVLGVSIKPIQYKNGSTLKLLYYSLISKDKGALDVIEAVKKMNQEHDIYFSIDFYGRVDSQIDQEFKTFIRNTDNANYKGMNDSKDINRYYSVLNSYDILLFPTQWRGEGVAGVCVEAKAAGIAVIASRHNTNSETIIEKNNEGLLIEKGNVQELVDTIKKLYFDSEFLNSLKQGSYESRKRYDVSGYDSLYSTCFQ